MLTRMVRAVAVAAAFYMASSLSAADPRPAFLKLIDRPKVPLAPKSEPGPDGVTKFSFASDATNRVPGLLVQPAAPASGKLPVVIVLHGTGGTKEGELAHARQLAAKGFLAIAIDGRYHGERAHAKGSADYQAAMLRTYQTGQEHPFIYDTVWDIMRLIDYIGTLPNADASRIGAIGFSKGGMELYLAAAVDQRIKASVPCIGVQSFQWALDNDSWQSRAGTFQTALDAAAKQENSPADAKFLKHFYDKVAPGIYTDFDGPAMVPYIAPRAMMTINGDIDPRTPAPGLKLCLDAAKAAYAREGHPERLEIVIQKNTAHQVRPEAFNQAVDFFVRWL